MLRTYLALVRQSSFLRMNAIFFVGSMVMAFINYLFYPVLGRLLPVAAFGELQVLVAVFGQIAIFLNVLTMISINIIVNEKDTDVANETITEIEKIALYIGGVFVLGVVVLSRQLQSVFQFSSPLPFLILALTVLVSIPASFVGAYLRGKRDFTATSIQGILSAIVKLGGAVGLVMAGFKAGGALTGLLLAQVISLVYAYVKARKLGFRRPKKHPKPNWNILKPQVKYALLVLAVSLMITLQASLDITAIKYLFSPDTAGRYAGISIISNIIFYIAGTFTTVMLSSVEQAKLPKENSNLLVKTLVVVLALSGVTAVVFALVPDLAIKLLIGSKYSEFAGLLPALSVSMLAMAVSNLFASYHIALRHHKVIYFVAVGALASYVLLAFNHSTPTAVVHSMLFGNIVMLVSLAGWTGVRALPRVHLSSSG